MSTKKLIFHLGGPSFHPVAEQARVIESLLSDEFHCEFRDGAEAFDALDDCDLLIIMGLHWPHMTDVIYRPLNDQQKAMFEKYVASGRPLLCHHGGIASYDDWPRFGQLLGYAWIWDVTQHSSLATHTINITRSAHPVTQGVTDYTIYDELYYDIKIAQGITPTVYAEVQWEGRALPMVMCLEGGRIEGAGRSLYLANGHDMRAFASPALKQLWLNGISWLTDSAK